MLQREKQEIELPFLEKVDIFGIGIHIKFNERDKHKTRIGGFFSVIVFILMLVFSLNLFTSIIYRRDPVVVFEQNSVIQPQRFDLNPQLFSIAFALYNEDLQPFIDETLYTMKGQIFHKNKEWDSKTNSYIEDQGNVDITLTPCTEQHFQEPESRSYFLALNYTQMYCIKDSSQLFIEGQFDADRFTMIRVNLSECLQSVNPNIICQDQQYRKQVLTNTKLQIYYVNRIIQIRNFDQPFQRVGQTQFWRTNYNMVQQLNLMFVNTYVADDVSLFYGENFVNQKDLVFSQERLLQGSRDPTKGENFYEIEIYMDKNKENIYRRRYLKFPQAISQIGGIFNVFFALGCLFSQPYAKMQLQRKLINQTFSFNNDDLDQRPPSKQKKIKNNKSSYNQYRSNSTATQNILINYQKSILNQTKSQGNSFRNNITNTALNSNLDMKQKSKQLNLNELSVRQLEKASIQETTFRNKDEYEKEQKYLTESARSSPDLQNTNNHIHKELKSNHQQIIQENIQISNQDRGNVVSNSYLEGTLDYFKSYLTYFSCYKNEKTDLLQYCIKKIYCYTDICFFINKLIELEKLKHLILDIDQINLFECIPKPRVGYSIIQNDGNGDIAQQNLDYPQMNDAVRYHQQREQTVDILSIQNRSIQERINQAQTALKRIQKKNYKSNKLDNKLIQMLDVNLIKILQEQDVNTSFDTSIYQRQDKNLISNKKLFTQTEEKNRDKELVVVTQAPSQSVFVSKINTPSIQSENALKESHEESIINLKDDISQIQRVYRQKDISIIPHHLTTNDIKHSEDTQNKIEINTQLNQNDISLCDQCFEIQSKSKFSKSNIQLD